MIILEPDGLFNGDRLRRCSNAAQNAFPRILLASDGYGRLEINYARIVGRAYATYHPVPTESEVQSWIQEFAQNYLLFLYEAEDGRVWGQWDTRPELLPKYKTASDRRSPGPPEPEFSEWIRSYRTSSSGRTIPNPRILAEEFRGPRQQIPEELPRSAEALKANDFRNVSGIFPPVVAVAVAGVVAEKTCPSAGANGRVSRLSLTKGGMTAEQEAWFSQWWSEYWRHEAKKDARSAFGKHIRTAELFEQVMVATRRQKPEMLSREQKYRPLGGTWLNGERWEDETSAAATQADDYPML